MLIGGAGGLGGSGSLAGGTGFDSLGSFSVVSVVAFGTGGVEGGTGVLTFAGSAPINCSRNGILMRAIAGLPPFVRTYKPSSLVSISETILLKLSRVSVSGTIRSIGTLIPPITFPAYRLESGAVNSPTSSFLQEQPGRIMTDNEGATYSPRGSPKRFSTRWYQSTWSSVGDEFFGDSERSALRRRGQQRCCPFFGALGV